MPYDDNVKMNKYFSDRINWGAVFTSSETPVLNNQDQDLENLKDSMNDLALQVKQLEHFLKTVFDGHVLIDGQFRKIIF